MPGSRDRMYRNIVSLPEAEERMYVYRGHDDDRPLLWKPHLNELIGVLGEVRRRSVHAA